MTQSDLPNRGPRDGLIPGWQRVTTESGASYLLCSARSVLPNSPTVEARIAELMPRYLPRPWVSLYERREK